MSEPARRPARYEDLLALPENVVGEIVGGEIVASPRPAPRHAEAATGVAGALIPPFHFGDGGPGGWRILVEPEVHLGENVVVPDLGAWRREHLPALPDAAYISVAPDWVCEILSPSTVRFDRVRKMPLYAQCRVRHLWAVDPVARTLEVLRNEGDHWVIIGAYGGDDVASAEPFEQIRISLARWWG